MFRYKILVNGVPAWLTRNLNAALDKVRDFAQLADVHDVRMLRTVSLYKVYRP